MSAIRGMLLAFAACLMLGCSSDPGTPTDWKSLALQGKRLVLLDEQKIETYAFHAEGLVSATLGTKDAMTGPLWYWRIDAGDLIFSEAPGPGSDAIERFRDPSIKGDVVTLKRGSGGAARFKLSES